MTDQPLSPFHPSQTYEQHLVPALFLPAAKILLDYAKPVSGEQVLDVACGTGIVARQVAPIVGTQGNVVALDISPAMLTVARSLPPPKGAVIEWQEGSALALPFPNHTFDLVLCQQGLQFFPDRGEALHQMHRVLVPNGRVVVSVQQSLDHNPVYQIFNEVLVRQLGIPAIAQPFSLADPQQLERLLIEAEFDQVEVIPVSHPVRFPDVRTFIQATIVGSAAAVPALAALDDHARADLIERVSGEVGEMADNYVEDGALVFSMASNIGRAQA